MEWQSVPRTRECLCLKKGLIYTVPRHFAQGIAEAHRQFNV
jgi:hypothetical protein